MISKYLAMINELTEERDEIAARAKGNVHLEKEVDLLTEKIKLIDGFLMDLEKVVIVG